MLNTSDLMRGFVDTIVLGRLKNGDSYGYEIGKNVKALTDGGFEMKEATLYTSFRRLEEAGMIRSYWGSENTGARRRYYSITASGRTLFEENREDWLRERGVIDTLLEVNEV